MRGLILIRLYQLYGIPSSSGQWVNPLARLVEYWTVVPEDPGSNPSRGKNVSVTFGAHVGTWVISGTCERLFPVHRPTSVGTPEESGTTLKKEGDNVVVLVIWHSYQLWLVG